MTLTWQNPRELIPLAEAAQQHLPAGRSGRAVSACTLWRWTRHGINGAKLAAVRIGGTVFTTEQAIRSFILASNATAGQAPPVQRRREVEMAERALSKMGVE